MLLGRGRIMLPPPRTRAKAVWYPRNTLVACLAMVLALAGSDVFAAGRSKSKLDDELSRRKNGNATAMTSVIVTLVPGATVPAEFKRFTRAKGKLAIINGHVLDLPNGVLRQLEARPEVFRIHHNRPTNGH